MPKKTMIDTMKRDKFDDLYTPEYAITPLLWHMPKNPQPKTIWECTDFGGSNITKLLKQSGYEVIGTDLIKGFDFLKDTPDFEFDMIVTNPPYSLKDKFIEKCYSYKKPFALLLPLTTLEGVFRGKLFREYGISLVVLDKRPDFTGKGACWFNVGWFCYGLDKNENQLIFETVKK